MNSLSRIHRWLGVGTLIVFLGSGAYMRLVAHPDRLADGAHLMFVSRHIYILANALVHLVLGAYVAPVSTRSGRTVQWIGSSLLVLSTVLLVAAFVVEPVAGQPRTLVSSFGLFALFGGSLLHFLVMRRRTAD